MFAARAPSPSRPPQQARRCHAGVAAGRGRGGAVVPLPLRGGGGPLRPLVLGRHGGGLGALPPSAHGARPPPDGSSDLGSRFSTPAPSRRSATRRLTLRPEPGGEPAIALSVAAATHRGTALGTASSASQRTRAPATTRSSSPCLGSSLELCVCVWGGCLPLFPQRHRDALANLPFAPFPLPPPPLLPPFSHTSPRPNPPGVYAAEEMRRGGGPRSRGRGTTSFSLD